MKNYSLTNKFNNELKVYKLDNFYVNPITLEKEFRESILNKYLPVWQETYRNDRNTVRKLSIENSRNFTFGGWTLLGESDNYDTGWTPDGEWLSFKMPKIDDFKYNLKTNLCSGIFSEIVNNLNYLNLNPCRMRITISKPNCDIAWHRDTNFGKEIFRLHIPIITNNTAKLCSINKKWHMPADGSAYIFNAHELHKVENKLSLRFHIMATVILPNEIYKNLKEVIADEERNYLSD